MADGKPLWRNCSSLGYGSSPLIGNICLNELGQKNERFLPAEVARLGGNNGRHTFLHDVQLGPARNVLQIYDYLDFPRHVRIVELVRVADAFVGNQFEIASAEGVDLAGREVRERHLEGAPDLGVHVMYLSRESVRRKPLAHGIGIEERAIHFFGGRTKDAVKTNGMGGHDICNFTIPRWARRR